TGRRFESFELIQNRRDTLRAFDSVIRRNFLPNKKETHEISSRNGFDFFTQTIERVAVNAREQSTRAPLNRRAHIVPRFFLSRRRRLCACRRELALHR